VWYRPQQETPLRQEFGKREALPRPDVPGQLSGNHADVIEVVASQGSVMRRPWRNWDRLTLPAMLPGENRWIGLTLPVGAGAESVASLVELKGDKPANGFSIVVQSAPINDVIAGVLVDHNKILVRLDQGFHIPAAGGTGSEHGGHEREGLDFNERVHVEAGDLRIEVDVRIRGGRRAGQGTPSAPPERSPANYEGFAPLQAKLLSACLSQLASGDPFGIGTAIAAITSAAEGDVSAVVTAHATVLNKFDAFLTMLQKAKGDRADILQMVRWHRLLCQSPNYRRQAVWSISSKVSSHAWRRARCSFPTTARSSPTLFRH
jgi:hypothetical protein